MTSPINCWSTNKPDVSLRLEKEKQSIIGPRNSPKTLNNIIKPVIVCPQGRKTAKKVGQGGDSVTRDTLKRSAKTTAIAALLAQKSTRKLSPNSGLTAEARHKLRASPLTGGKRSISGNLSAPEITVTASDNEDFLDAERHKK